MLKDFDVTLIFLAEPFEITEYVQLIDMADVEPAIGEVTTVVGWGLNSAIDAVLNRYFELIILLSQ